MGSTPISTACLLICLAAVALLERAVGLIGSGLQLDWLLTIALKRTLQAIAVVGFSWFFTRGTAALGLHSESLLAGLKKGLVWSACFAAVAGLLFLGLFLIGQNPIRLIYTPLPDTALHKVQFFIVAGMVGPIAEEIVFRGLIFGYLRRWGVTVAVVISTALFAALHVPAVPVTQIIGGAVFAVAYHTGGSLMVPIVIHMLGNLAIFTLSLPVFH